MCQRCRESEVVLVALLRIGVDLWVLLVSDGVAGVGWCHEREVAVTRHSSET